MTKQYNIKPQIDMQGTVTDNGTSLIWQLTSPITKTIYYGLPGDIPATWIDKSTNPATEQMAVIRGNVVYLDQNLSGTNADASLFVSEVSISGGGSNTAQISYPKSDMLLYVIVAVVLVMLYFALKR